MECVRGWCKHFRAPAVKLFHAPREDRCLIQATDEWLKWIDANSQGPFACLHSWNRSIRRHNPLGLDQATAREGWRGERPFGAIQIILHHLVGKSEFLEIDFDEAGPGQGLLPAAWHGIEVVRLRLPRLIGRPKWKTNPYRIARLLRRSGIEVERV